MSKRSRASVVTIGMFDGVHRGHQEILKVVVKDAEVLRATPIVVTFDRHPQKVLKEDRVLGMIATTQQRLHMFKRCGVSTVRLIHFTRRFSRTTPQTFVKDLLMRQLGMKELCVGHDFAFGKDRSGGRKLLREMSRRWGFRLKIFKPFKSHGRIISSTAIRDFLRKGQVQSAGWLLGRPYAMQGVVRRGSGLGKKLGFPTANLRMKGDSLLPDGVYAVIAKGVSGSSLRPGVLNVGRRPTMRARHRSGGRHWEVHFWNFHKSLYGNSLEISFVKRLRSEQTFQSPEALCAQIKRDIKIAKTILRNHK